MSRTDRIATTLDDYALEFATQRKYLTQDVQHLGLMLGHLGLTYTDLQDRTRAANARMTAALAELEQVARIAHARSTKA